MNVTAYEDAAAFLAAAEPFLTQQETLNSLMLGIVISMTTTGGSARRRFQPLLLTVDDDHDPRLAAFMNSPQKLLLGGTSQTTLPTIEPLVTYLDQRMPGLPAVFGPEGLSEPFAQVWTRHRGHEAQIGLSQLLYELQTVVLPPSLPPGLLRPANINDRAVAAEWMVGFQREAMRQQDTDIDAARYVTDMLIARGELYVWQAEPSGSGAPLSMAARARPTPGTVAVNFVYTPPPLRGRGYASACVGHLSLHLLDTGWKSVNLFTDRANPTSNHIYERLGYQPVTVFVEYRFSDARSERGVTS